MLHPFLLCITKKIIKGEGNVKRILDEEHPDTLGVKLNLAISYSNVGDYQTALKLDKEVLEARKRILGEEHPDTLKVKYNLAISYSDVEDYHTALKLAEEVLETRKKILGNNHPDTVLTNELIEDLKKTMNN